MTFSDKPDRLLNAVRAVDVLACLALFGVALLCRLPLVPHFNVSSDSMDPLLHAWQMLAGTTSPFSAFSPLYGYARAWCHIPLLLGSDGLLDVVRAAAVSSSFVPVFVYIAGRIVLGGTGPAPGGTIGRRAGALLGPLLGGALLARYPGYLQEQIFPHLYRSPELGAALTIPFALLLREAGLGGSDREEPSRPSRRTVLGAAAAVGLLIPLMGLNHPYGAAAGGAMVPLLVLLLVRRGRTFLAPLALCVGVAFVVALPHLLYLATEAMQMGDGLVGFVRADTEFGAMGVAMSFDRLLAERLQWPSGSLLARAPLAALVLGALATIWRPRLGGATALVGGSALSALLAAFALSKVSQHIQPYHWRPILPFFALSAGLLVATVLDIGLRRTRAERAGHLEQRQKLAHVMARRLPATAFGALLVVLILSAVNSGFQADEGNYRALGETAVIRQGQHHERITRRITAIRDRTGALPLFAGLEFPPFEVVVDQGAVALDMLLGGVTRQDMLTAWAGDPAQTVLLHIGLGDRPMDKVVATLRPDMAVVDGGPEYLMVSATASVLRLWSRSLCPAASGPRWLLHPDEGEEYRLRGYLEVRQLIEDGVLYVRPYDWAHPCMEPYAWPNFEAAEYPFAEPGHAPFGDIDPQTYFWVNLGPGSFNRTEMPRRTWDQCVAAGVCAPQEWPLPEDPWLPITGVSADQAAGLCRWLVQGREREGRIWTGDLPTEMEWELAATWHQGVSEVRVRWPWGDEPTLDKANIAHPEGGPHPVGAWLPGASPMDLEDMVGNVAEWVRRARRPGDGDRVGAPLDGYLLAGGSWRTPADVILGGMFETPEPERPLDDVGFRCVIRAQDAP